MGGRQGEKDREAEGKDEGRKEAEGQQGQEADLPQGWPAPSWP